MRQARTPRNPRACVGSLGGDPPFRRGGPGGTAGSASLRADPRRGSLDLPFGSAKSLIAPNRQRAITFKGERRNGATAQRRKRRNGANGIGDANTSVQPLSTQSDVAGNLACVNVPASVVAGVAQPNSRAAPLAVMNTAGVAAVDGSGSVGVGGTAQLLFGGTVPANGYLVANNSAGTLYVSDIGAATAGGASIQIAAGAVFVTPSGCQPPGPVSIFGATTAQAFAARKW